MPPTKSAAATNKPISEASKPAAAPIMIGGAIIPPFIVSTYCSP